MKGCDVVIALGLQRQSTRHAGNSAKVPEEDISSSRQINGPPSMLTE